MTDAISLSLACPVCEIVLGVLVRPADPSTEPPGWVVEEISGCPHADDLSQDLSFVDAALEAAQDGPPSM